ncbi:MAG TPA: glycosyltransferase family 4 protein, partial [Chitinophagaceae bacterium]|nr:glycosyltransferase family 4 protein [Chitinophagaceae bacterium]
HKLRDKIGQIKFLVIGHTTPGYLNYIESIVERLQLKEHFEYVGNKSYDELPQYLQKADIGLAIFKPIELRKYAFSLKVIEYMAAGLAVVTTRETQSAALVTGHECGEAVAFNSEELSEALYRMLTNREQLKRYVENAIRHSREYDWENLMNRKLELIRSYYQKAYPPMKP